MLLPSTFSTTLGFLFFLTLKNGSIVNMLSSEKKLRKKVFLNLKIKIILARGIILSGMTMAHPLYGLIYIIFYFLFEIISFLIVLIRDRSNITRKIINIGHFSIQLITIFSTFLVMMLPYILYYASSFGYSLWESYYFYIKPISLFDPLNGIVKIGEIFIKIAEDLLYKTLWGDYELEVFKRIFASVDMTNMVHFFWINGSGIIFLIIGVFIPANYIFRINKKQKNLISGYFYK